MGEMRAVRRSTRSHPPGCHCQCGGEADSWGRLSLTRKARRITKSRSVTSWAGPRVNSLTRAGARRGRTFKVSGRVSGLSLEDAVVGSHWTVVHLPKVMV